jgi:polysaccharide pyruvyl transferase WcaK-like protein
MKALFVGDNSINMNWGGRGGSIALLKMLEEKFQISGIIQGNAFLLDNAGFGYVNTRMPSKYNWIFLYLLANRHRRKIFDVYVRLEEWLGAKDFIAHDPTETVENILRYKTGVTEIQEIYKKVQDADILIIHGEGDLVFTSPPRRTALFLLGIAELGLRLNKKVVIANSLISDCPSTGRNLKTLEYARSTLSRCDAVIVRDYQSLEYMKTEIPTANCSLVPDSLFTWYPIVKKSKMEIPSNGDFIIPYPENKTSFGKLDFSKPYICIGGSAIAGQNREKSLRHFTMLLAKIQKLGYPVYLAETCVGDSFLQTIAEKEGVGLIPGNTAIFMCGAILANAMLFVSGRYHPSILASLGGTPCIFLGSSAHKMHSLQKLLEYEYIREFPVHPSNKEMDEILELAKSHLNHGEALRNKISATAGKLYAEAIRLPEVIFQQVVKHGGTP